MASRFLEGYAGTRRALQRIWLFRFPFRIGRAEGFSLTLDSVGISRVYAEFVLADDHLLVRNHGIAVIAEGVSSVAEIAFCADPGIELLQGFRFGRPAALGAP